MGGLGHTLSNGGVVSLLGCVVSSSDLELSLLRLGCLVLLLLSELGLLLGVHPCRLSELRHRLLRSSLRVLNRSRLAVGPGCRLKAHLALLALLGALVSEHLLLLQRHLHRTIARDDCSAKTRRRSATNRIIAHLRDWNVKDSRHC